MAKEKRPSIYSDRGTIGSSSELDEYGVWVKNEPQDLTSESFEASDNSAEFSDEAISTDDLDFGIPDIDELPDFDTLDAEVSKNTSPDREDEDGDFDLPDLDDEQTEPEAEEESDGTTFNFGDFLQEDIELPAESEVSEESEVMLDTEIPEMEEDSDNSENQGFAEVPMDDFIGTLDTEPENEAEEPKSTGGQQDLSTQLLMKIADELSSIRSELQNLKKEFSVIQSAAPKVETGDNDYYDEEDDEKIALTGAELINIMNTAEFKEETGTDAAAEFSEDMILQEAEGADLSSADELASDSSDPFKDIDITLTELDSTELVSAELGSDETGMDELGSDIQLDDLSDLGSVEQNSVDLTEDTLPVFSDEDTDELKQIRENGAEPISFAPDPEDTDYLEKDITLEDMDITEEAIDLSGAVIDEPDLSSEIHENPLEEPSLEDISISLDLSELDSSDLQSVDLQSEDSDSMDSGEIDINVPEKEEEMEIPLNLSDLDSVDFQSLDLGSDELESDEPASEDLGLAEEDGEINSGADLSLIPEGFVVESSESKEETISIDDLDSLEIDEEPTIEESEEIPPIESPAFPDSVEMRGAETTSNIPARLKQDLKAVLSYMDQLLEALPDDKIEEFAKSEHFDTYKKLFKELGLV